MTKTPTITCSYCSAEAIYAGGEFESWGQDGDFYCEATSTARPSHPSACQLLRVLH